MKTIIYLKEVHLLKIIFGVLLMLMGIAALFTHIFFAAIMLGIGANLIYTTGSEIDLENHKFRKLGSFLGIRFGKWTALPKMEYVSVFATTESQRVNGLGATATTSEKIILLNLFDTSNKKLTAYKTTDKSQAFKVAQHLALALDIAILDATEKEKKWVGSTN